MTPAPPSGPRAIAAGLAAVLVAGAAWPALAGPDFATADRARALAASDGRGEQEPSDEIAYARSATDLDDAARILLAAVAAWLAGHPGHRLVLEAHADRSGAATFKAALAARRAELARNHLIRSGIARERIVVAVYGQSRSWQRPDPHERRLVLFATRAPLARLIAAELDHDALEVTWTQLGAGRRARRGITPVAAIGGDAGTR